MLEMSFFVKLCFSSDIIRTSKLGQFMCLLLLVRQCTHNVHDHGKSKYVVVFFF